MGEMMFKAKSATRVDLAGGTLDLWPLSTLVANATTVNCSISCYTTVEFKKSDKMSVFVESPDFKEKFEFSNLTDFFNKKDSKLSILQEAFSVLADEKSGLGEWVIKSESPAGSGLGGSSSLLISMLKVLFNINGEDYSEKSIIESAKNIESRVLRTPAGIQDYFSPVKEGLNLIEYKEAGFERTDMSETLSFWKDSITIVDSQIKHHSGMNNWDILKKYIDQDEKVVKAIESISKVSIDTKKALEAKSMDALIDCFKGELEARKAVSDSYINDELSAFLDKLSKVDDVLSLKVCGAGGGGCVLVLHKSKNKTNVQESLKAMGVSVLPFELTGL